MINPSIVLVPSGVSVGKVFAQIPTPAFDLDFARNSTASRVDSGGNTVNAAINFHALTFFYRGKQRSCPSGVLRPAASPREADVLLKTGQAARIGQVEGYLFADVNLENTATTTRTILGISDTTTNNRISIRKTTTNAIQVIVTNGGSNTVDITTTTNLFGRFKIVVSYEIDNVFVWINGIRIGGDTSTAIPTCSAIYFGKIENSTNDLFLNDTYNRYEIGMNKLTETEAQELSSFNTITELADALSYI